MGIIFSLIFFIHFLIVLVLQQNSFLYFLNRKTLNVSYYGFTFYIDIIFKLCSHLIEKRVFQCLPNRKPFVRVEFQRPFKKIFDIWGNKIKYLGKWLLIYFAKGFNIIPSSLVTNKANIFRSS